VRGARAKGPLPRALLSNGYHARRGLKRARRAGGAATASGRHA